MMDYGFYVDKTLYNNLMLVRGSVINQDMDACILITGEVGAGKSVLAPQVGHVLDVDHKIDINTQLCYTPKQFKHAVATLKPGKAIIWDEAMRGVNRRRTMSSMNVDIVEMLAECRQKNLFLIVVMPNFFIMDREVALDRSRFLLHVYVKWNPANKEKPLVRGFFRFYSKPAKAMLYNDGYCAKSQTYPVIQGKCFDGTFPHHYVFDEQEYRKRKKESYDFYRDEESKQNAFRCSECLSTQTRYKKQKDVMYCTRCGHEWEKKVF